jgi:Na+-transporting NADH:ubiquinone oxidoreductase subunit NqrC
VNERIIILMVLSILAAIAVVVYAMTGSPKRAEKSDDERTSELLRMARLMFPSAENDIFALDALYQHTFRRRLITQKEGKHEAEALKHDLILIFNAKNRAIIELYDSKNAISRFYQSHKEHCIESLMKNDTTNVYKRFNTVRAPPRRDTNNCFETILL